MTVSLSTHVLDAVGGAPAANVPAVLSSAGGVVAATATDADGRIRWDVSIDPGDYRLSFATGEWSAALGRPTFYPTVDLHVAIADGHTHVALLLSAYSYTTYKGS